MSSSFFHYLDDLLMLQSGAVERYKHLGIKGSAREEFILEQINKIIPDLKDRLHTGELVDQNMNLGQQDILIRRKDAMNTTLGGQIQLCCNDCNAFIEVKTSLEGSHLSKVEKASKSAKLKNPRLMSGVFAYATTIKRKTILSRFGYSYNEDADMVISMSNPSITYPNIDFILCLSCKEDEQGLYLTKDSQTGNYLYFSAPYTEYFMKDLGKAI